MEMIVIKDFSEHEPTIKEGQKLIDEAAINYIKEIVLSDTPNHLKIQVIKQTIKRNKKNVSDLCSGVKVGKFLV